MSNGEELIVATGKMFELVQTIQPDGRVFEKARRAPGVRLIIPDRAVGKLLLTREFRSELDGWDYRLPGGKVFDSLSEFEAFRTSGQDIESAAAQKARDEAEEEAGVRVTATSLVARSTLGATVEWDLYIFEATVWQPAEGGQKLEAGEQIEAGNWLEYDKVEEMILAGHLQEDRVALRLLQWLHKQRFSEGQGIGSQV
jgi:8-oxo-dGTP pyrophosphatase MutT (NUDIX family)